MISFPPVSIAADQAGATLAAALRSRQSGQSWNQVRRLSSSPKSWRSESLKSVHSS
jgi:hypothetical protein